MAKNIFAGVKNSELFKLAQAYSPTFKANTSKVTAEKLDAGWEANSTLTNLNEMISDWYNVVQMMVLNKVSIATAKNPLENYGVVEAYETPFGNYTQRLAVLDIDAISPAFVGLENGDSVDMQKIRKGRLESRIFEQNFCFQNYVTIDDYRVRQILANEFGMSEIIGGFTSQLEASYTKQRYVNELEALNTLINSTEYPLKDTQKLELDSWTAKPEDGELLDFIQSVKNLIANMTLVPSSGAYNAAGFESAVNTEDMVLLVRNNVLTEIETRTMVGAFNPEFLKIGGGVDIKPVLNFGGLEPFVKTGNVEHDIYPVYDAEGTVIGYAPEQGATSAEYRKDDPRIQWRDTNEDILGVLISRGALFTTQQCPVEVAPAPYNIKGRYQNIYFNVANAGIHGDYFYNLVIITKPAAASE